MSMTIQESRAYIERKYQWVIDEQSFRVIAEHRCMWVAKVTATHPSHSFLVLVEYKYPFILDLNHLSLIAQWAKEIQ